MPEYRLMVYGLDGAGKSALTFRFIQNIFEEDFDPEITDNYRKEVLIDNPVTGGCILDILDCSLWEWEGEDRIRRTFMREAPGFLFAYSITCRESFLQMTDLIDVVTRRRRRACCSVQMPIL